uniref:Hydroxyproline-rich glycoprotein family protein n=1 Tax=Noccaea caerulescens TaxID=107243 RepID=A0A1J3DD14_NOCCA
MRGGASGNSVFETINAAATAIASSDDRVHQASPIRKKRKWWNRLSIFFICFRPSKQQRKRIGKASLAPEPVQMSSDSTSGYRSVITALPFIAPPSSPASFFQSEPPSATQSPVGILSFSPIPSSNSNNRPSIFAIGPYAHELQLVSPPVFSTYTTEPSSAPITPPPDESIYLATTTTTPSSPEVPFAQLFNSNLQNGDYGGGHHRFPISNYEFQFYQLPPGSPLGQLISPSSVVSGSGPTSPFPDGETATARFLPQFQDPPKLLSPRCSKTRLHKPVSFDLDADHVIRCVDQKLRTTFPEASASSNQEEATTQQESSLGSNKEFNFGTDEKGLTIDEEQRASSTKNSNEWSFFPVMQSGTLS